MSSDSLGGDGTCHRRCPVCFTGKRDALPIFNCVISRDATRLAQSEQAFLAIAQGTAPKEATVKILDYKEMEPFFVKGESDEP
jgi:hypothetical protein